MEPKSLVDYYKEEKRIEDVEHRDVLLAIGVLLKSAEGIQLFAYLFKSLDVATLPERGLEGNDLHDHLGFLRAGNSIYKLVCEADPEIAASILSKLERKRYERLYEQHRIDSGYNSTED